MGEATAKWYIESGGKTYGPHTVEQLKKFVEGGQVTAETRVCPLGGQAWLRMADALPELLQGVPPPPPPPLPAGTGEPSRRPPSRDEKECPYCSEIIKIGAIKCKYCGSDLSDHIGAQGTAQPPKPPLTDRELAREQGLSRREESGPDQGFGPSYNAPVGVGYHKATERTATGGQRSFGGFAFQFKGALCPECGSGDYVNKYSIWHGLLALCAFPFGLLFLFLPVKRCRRCKTLYGMGYVIVRIVALLFLILFTIIVCIIVIGLIAGVRGS